MDNERSEKTLDKMSLYEWVFNPFETINGISSLVFGLIILIFIAFFATLSNVFFPGIIDCLNISSIAYNPEDFQFYVLLIQLLASWIILSIFFIIFSILIPFNLKSLQQVNLLDVLGSTALSRYPYLILVILLSIIHYLNPQILTFDLGRGISHRVTVWTTLLSASIFMCFAWQLITYYYAFKASSHLKGAKLLVSYIVIIFLGEICSVYVIMYLLI